MTEKRRFKRTYLPIPVKVHFGERAVWDCVENISSGGAFISGSYPVDQGARLELSFSFPGLPKPIRLPCRVVRRERGGIGVHFIPYPVGTS